MATEYNPSVTTVYRGHLVQLPGDPTLREARAALVEERDGMLIVGTDGRIEHGGAFDADLVPDDATVVDERGRFILPGFVDAHVHYPQVHAVHAWNGGTLLEWLDDHVFPAEARLADPEEAAQAARDLADGLLSAGTTSAMIYGSQFPEAQEALFQELSTRGIRAIVGRTTMTVGPAPLITSINDALRLCEDEIQRWHGSSHELIQVALMPRFALSLQPRELAELGKLWERVRDGGVRFSSHLAEDPSEVTEVCRRYAVERYLDAYDRCGFLGPHSVLAHGVHCDEVSAARLAATGTSIAHCPTSQLYLGNAAMPLSRMEAADVPLCLGSDVAAGDTFSMPEVLNATYKVHLGSATPRTLHPAELLHLATLGGAQALGINHRAGNLDPGKDADLAVIDPELHPPLSRRLAQVSEDDGEQRLFTLLMGIGRDTIARTVIRNHTRYRLRHP